MDIADRVVHHIGRIHAESAVDVDHLSAAAEDHIFKHQATVSKKVESRRPFGSPAVAVGPQTEIGHINTETVRGECTEQLKIETGLFSGSHGAVGDLQGVVMQHSCQAPLTELPLPPSVVFGLELEPDVALVSKILRMAEPCSHISPEPVTAKLTKAEGGVLQGSLQKQLIFIGIQCELNL